jgi:hypothetical protein
LFAKTGGIVLDGTSPQPEKAATISPVVIANSKELFIGFFTSL